MGKQGAMHSLPSSSHTTAGQTSLLLVGWEHAATSSRLPVAALPAGRGSTSTPVMHATTAPMLTCRNQYRLHGEGQTGAHGAKCARLQPSVLCSGRYTHHMPCTPPSHVNMCSWQQALW